MLKGYITNLGKYNEGYLIGEWITFPVSEEDLQEVLKRIGINDQYEEYFFTDWENDYDIDFNFGEYESIDHINEVIEAIENLDFSELELLKAVYECEGLPDIEEFNPDNYIWYEGMTLEEVAYDIVEGTYYSKDNDFLLRYFDYEAFSRDLSFEGYQESKYGVYIEC